MKTCEKRYPVSDYTETGRRIKAMRKALNLTQKEFAERFGMSQSTVYCWEAKSQINQTKIPDWVYGLLKKVIYYEDGLVFDGDSISVKPDESESLRTRINELELEIAELKAVMSKHNARNAGRRKDEPCQVEKYRQYASYQSMGMERDEIIKTMGISLRTAVRYEKWLADKNLQEYLVLA